MKKVTIILPAFNVEDYISDSISSVVNQTYKNWELIIVNDGSTDNTKGVINSFEDSRILYFEQINKGVSAARNIGLRNMSGDYFCFLDADDAFTVNSISHRIDFFNRNQNVNFVDGKVFLMDHKLKSVVTTWCPGFIGNPLKDLISLKGRSFFGPSWLIKREENKNYQFHTEISHGEDLLFFLELSLEGGIYSYIEEPILKYRNTPGSAMKNLMGLENGYRYIENIISQWPEVDNNLLKAYKYRYRKSMALSYLSKGQIFSAIKQLIH